jgi:hypothetical protein
MFFNGVGVDAIVEFGERAVKVPCQGQAVTFVFFKSTEFFKKIKFKFGADPRAEFERNIRMGIGAAIASRRGTEANGVGLFYPIFDT